MSELPLSGRCYCGQVSIAATAQPIQVTYCHCSDCRRLSGAPVAAFAAFAPDQVAFSPALGPGKSFSKGVDRWFCSECGTQLCAQYDYLPGQLYLPLGLLNQAAELPPTGHSHAASALPWLNIQDDLPRDTASGRDRLNRDS